MQRPDKNLHCCLEEWLHTQIRYYIVQKKIRIEGEVSEGWESEGKKEKQRGKKDKRKKEGRTENKKLNYQQTLLELKIKYARHYAYGLLCQSLFKKEILLFYPGQQDKNP